MKELRQIVRACPSGPFENDENMIMRNVIIGSRARVRPGRRVVPLSTLRTEKKQVSVHRANQEFYFKREVLKIIIVKPSDLYVSN